VTRKLFSIAFIIFISCASASAQTSAKIGETETSNRTSADETFDLNIAERRITEHDFAASTSVEIGEEAARGLMLRVGVAVGAQEINVLLRNVSGHVRFRATLDRVLERLRAQRAPSTTP
jgi:hypothetical protein